MQSLVNPVMQAKKKVHPTEKVKLHIRNQHREKYDFELLTESSPELKKFVKENDFGNFTIDFFDPEAVKSLNKALLQHYYGMTDWSIPTDYLCPPIPGRADYIHHIADLLADSRTGKSEGEVPMGKKIKCLDIGIGANAVYPIIGRSEYQWSFIGSDVDPIAIESANRLVKANAVLKGNVDVRLQTNTAHVFEGIIQPEDLIDLTICNPPFHASQEAAAAGTMRKLSNLKQEKATSAVLNFGGQPNELWCEGGEAGFVERMIRESKQFASNCFWFSTLISKESNLKNAGRVLRSVDVLEVKILPMAQGNKTSRILAWTFLTKEEQAKWMKQRWK
ncbi:MAG: 23S rRNA (adenine(1618)-N(6))-methyltransferase RlmF [Fluviicola sp.]|nr:23S rRNA (adenine(1618)-N(6))-methyltransferase RlmF [Fluviicola sp.]